LFLRTTFNGCERHAISDLTDMSAARFWTMQHVSIEFCLEWRILQYTNDGTILYLLDWLSWKQGYENSDNNCRLWWHSDKNNKACYRIGAVCLHGNFIPTKWRKPHKLHMTLLALH
jgi:hypothetical protein